MTTIGPPASGLAAGVDGLEWHTLSADQVLQAERQPRPPDQPILTRGRFAWLISVGLVMGAGPLQAFLKTTSLDVRQWLICLTVALSIVVVSEIRKAVRRRTVSSHPTTR